MKKLGYLLAGCTLAALLTASAASAQSHPEFVPLGRVSAALYKPDSGPAPHIAFLVAHRSGNNLNNIACRELSRRGFAVALLQHALHQQRHHRGSGADRARREDRRRLRPHDSGDHEGGPSRP